jgi:hypothetical protein
VTVALVRLDGVSVHLDVARLDVDEERRRVVRPEIRVAELTGLKEEDLGDPSGDGEPSPASRMAKIPGGCTWLYLDQLRRRKA